MSLRPHHHHILHTALLLGYPSEMRHRYHFLLGKSPIRLLDHQAAIIRLRVEATSTSHSLPLPSPIILSHTRPDAPSSGTPPLHLLSADRRVNRPEVTLPPRKRLGIALGPRYEVGESSSAAAARPTGGLRENYSFVATIDREIMRDLERDDREMSVMGSSTLGMRCW
ncbi:hypothetical protein Tco_0487186 [Tanacetum coccineum]